MSVSSPASVAGSYLVGSASFGAPLGSPGLTAEIMPVVDASAAGNSCTPLNAANALAVNGKFALVDRGVYKIDDRSGQLWVVSDRGVPRKGAHVTVKGTIREGFNLGSLGKRAILPPALESGLIMMESSHKATD